MSDVLISTDEAAALLEVKPATIYTYVSRGRIESIRKVGSATSWFRRADVERLASRRSRLVLDDPDREHFTFVTAITELDGYSYRYRGQDPGELSAQYTFEQVAEFLWTGAIPEQTCWAPRSSDIPKAVARAVLDADALPLDRLRVAVSALGASDPLRFGRQPAALVVTARQLLADMVDSLPSLGEAPHSNSIAAQLWSKLSTAPSTPAQIDALERALIVIADHGVAPSTSAARIAAAYQADLYGVVEAGLAIMAGAWYGGRALSAEVMLKDIERLGDAEAVVGELYRKGGIPCLGQPRYHGHDPRTNIIVDLVKAAAPGHAAFYAVAEICRIVDERALPGPSVELGIAVLANAFDLIKGASETIFAIGRTAGWMAHAMEVYARPPTPSPEFSYVGLPSQGES